MSTVADNFFIFPLKKIKHFLKWCEVGIMDTTLNHFLKNKELNDLMSLDYNMKDSDTLKKVTKSMQSPYHEFDENFDLTCAVSMWIWNDNVVVKFFGMREFSDIKKPRYLDNFEYWNNTDKPDEVKPLEWARRARFYDKTIEDLHRMEYSPLDFLSNSRHRSILRLRSYHKRKQLPDMNRTTQTGAKK